MEIWPLDPRPRVQELERGHLQTGNVKQEYYSHSGSLQRYVCTKNEGISVFNPTQHTPIAAR